MALDQAKEDAVRLVAGEVFPVGAAAAPGAQAREAPAQVC